MSEIVDRLLDEVAEEEVEGIFARLSEAYERGAGDPPEGQERHLLAATAVGLWRIAQEDAA